MGGFLSSQARIASKVLGYQNDPGYKSGGSIQRLSGFTLGPLCFFFRLHPFILKEEQKQKALGLGYSAVTFSLSFDSSVRYLFMQGLL